MLHIISWNLIWNGTNSIYELKQRSFTLLLNIKSVFEDIDGGFRHGGVDFLWKDKDSGCSLSSIEQIDAALLEKYQENGKKIEEKVAALSSDGDFNFDTILSNDNSIGRDIEANKSEQLGNQNSSSPNKVVYSEELKTMVKELLKEEKEKENLSKKGSEEIVPVDGKDAKKSYEELVKENTSLNECCEEYERLFDAVFGDYPDRHREYLKTKVRLLVCFLIILFFVI